MCDISQAMHQQVLVALLEKAEMWESTLCKNTLKLKCLDLQLCYLLQTNGVVERPNVSMGVSRKPSVLANLPIVQRGMRTVVARDRNSFVNGFVDAFAMNSNFFLCRRVKEVTMIEHRRLVVVFPDGRQVVSIARLIIAELNVKGIFFAEGIDYHTLAVKC